MVVETIRVKKVDGKWAYGYKGGQPIQFFGSKKAAVDGAKVRAERITENSGTVKVEVFKSGGSLQRTEKISGY